MCDTNDHGCNLKLQKLVSSLCLCGIVGMGIRKESEACEGTLSHFGLKPCSEITFVIEKVLDITRPVSVMYQSVPGHALVSSKPDHPPPQATPGDSHILVGPGVGFSLLCLAKGFALGGLKSK